VEEIQAMRAATMIATFITRRNHDWLIERLGHRTRPRRGPMRGGERHDRL
jgi:hypothetical protein